MIRTTTAAKPWPLPFGGGKATFMLRAGDVIERGEFEAELSGMGAGKVYDWQLEEVFFIGLTTLLPDPADLERFREIQSAVKTGDSVPAESLALLDAAKAAVSRAWPAYRELLAQMERRTELVPTMAFMWFCDGWEGRDLEGEPLPEVHKSIDGRITLDTIKKVPPILVTLAGGQAYNLLWATGEEKNFAGLSRACESPKRSKAPQKKAGSSAGRSGRKTPSRRPRAGRSPSSTSG